MFDALYTVSSSVAVSTASKLLNMLFEELKDTTNVGNRKLVVTSKDVMKRRNEKLESDDLATQLYREIMDNRAIDSPEFSEDELRKLTQNLSEVIKSRLVEDGKVDKKRGRKLLQNLRDTIP